MIKAVLFDFDGVLTIDATGSETICKYISKQTGIYYNFLLESYRKYNKDLQYGKKTHKDIWQSLCNDVNMEIDMDLLYESFINTPMDNEMLNLAQKLKINNYKIGIITDNKKDRIDSIVSNREWNKLFDVIKVSACVGSGKDNQEIFLQTLEKLEILPEECIFIDNNQDNLTVPKDLGVNVLFFDHEKRDISDLINNLSLQIDNFKEIDE